MIYKQIKSINTLERFDKCIKIIKNDIDYLKKRPNDSKFFTRLIAFLIIIYFFSFYLEEISDISSVLYNYIKSHFIQFLNINNEEL